MKQALVVLSLVAAAGVARAQPMVSVSVTQRELADGFAMLTDHLEEPVGLLASADVPVLGLHRGDVVIALDGKTPKLNEGSWRTLPDLTPVLYLDVLRGKQRLVVRIAVQFGAIVTHTHEEYIDHDLEMADRYSDVRFAQVTRGGAPSGVLVLDEMVGLGTAIAPGDVVRRVDGKQIATVAELVDALKAAKAHPQILFDVERLGQPIRVTVYVDPEPKPDPVIADGIAHIKRLDDHTFEVPSSLVDAIMRYPMPAARSVRIVPAMMNGKIIGVKLYAIRPGSLAAALGLMNGDTLRKVGSTELTDLDKALEAYTHLRDATDLKIELTRRGKPLELEYKIK